MKRTFLIAFTLLVAASVSLFASGSSQATATGTTGREVLSAPGVFPITKERSNFNVFFVEYDDRVLPSNNTFMKELEDTTNVHLNQMIVPEEAANERLALLLNTGEYPEVLIKMNGTASRDDMLKYGTGEKIFIPLEDIIAQHAPNTTAYFAEYPWVRESMLLPDGHIYGIPSIMTGANTPNHGAISYRLHINQTWLDKLGLKRPTTTEEFRTVLRAFKTQDPNGNGRADEVPLSGAIGTWAADIYPFMLNAFGFYDGITHLNKNGKVVDTLNQDYIREGLKYIRSLYDEGLIDPAALTQNDPALSALANQNPPVLGSYTAGHVGMGVSVANIPLASQYNALEPIMGPTGYRGIAYYDFTEIPGTAARVITDKCKNPALVVKWFDTICNSDYWAVRGQVGVQGKQWDYADPGTFGMDGVTPAKYKRYTAGGDDSTGDTIDTIGWHLVGLQPDWKGLFQVVGDIRDPSNYEAFIVQETLKLIPYAAPDIMRMPALNYSVDIASRQSQIETPITDHWQTALTEFITGRRNPASDADWNTFKQELTRLGYNEYVSNRQTAYNATLKK
jgi:putative aldouronate transport system substrate-binding protein